MGPEVQVNPRRTRRRLRELPGARPLLRLALLAGLVALPLSAAASLPPLPGPPVPNPVIPPVGTQNSAPASQCSFPNLGNTIHQLVSGHPSATGSSPKVASWFAPDPFGACHMYMSDAHLIMRSDNSGASFDRQAFQDNTAGAVPGDNGITISQVVPDGAPGAIFIYDQSGRNGVFYSPDYGVSWAERDNGLYLGNAGPSGGIDQLAVAPSNPNVVYLLGTTGTATVNPQPGSNQSVGTSVIFESTDRGQSWGALVPPTDLVSSIAVDPNQPSRLFAAGGSGVNHAVNGAGQQPLVQGTVYDNRGGNTWISYTPPSSTQSSPIQLFATSLRRQTRLYALTEDFNGANQNWEWTSDFNKWNVIATDHSDGQKQRLTWDPNDPNQMVLAVDGVNSAGAHGIWLLGSTNGFDSTAYAKFLGAVGVPDAIDAAADGYGNFFVKTTGNAADNVWAFRMSALIPPPVPTADDGHVPLLQCPLQPLTPTLTGPYTGGPYKAGSITFDGKYLDYTQDDYAPGVIFRIDPANHCAMAPPLTLNKADTGGNPAVLISLTYDPRYVFEDGVTVGAILARASGDGNDPGSPMPVPRDPRTPFGYSALYAINPDPSNPKAELVTALPCNDPATKYWDWACQDKDPKELAYDPFLDAIWGPSYFQDLAPVLGLIQIPSVTDRGGSPATPIPTCISGIHDLTHDIDTGGQVGQAISSLVPGDKGILYMQMEDDRYVYRVDSSTCTILDHFQHKRFSEGDPNEDDQMACDPLTFGEGGPLYSYPGTSVIWIRNVLPNNVTAYPIAHGFCPFPTAMTADANPKQAPPGTPVTGCATLSVVTSGLASLMGNRSLSFSVDGHAVGSAATNDAGLACLDFAMPAADGWHRMVATFAGNEAFLPRSAAALVKPIVTPVQPTSKPYNPLAVPPQPAPQPPLALIPAPPAPVPQAQTQVQTQVQAQAQTQPGAMTQKQERTRVSLARIDGGRNSVDLEASRLDSALFVEYSGAAMFGLALLLLQRRLRRHLDPRPSPIRAEPRRRR